MKTLNFTMVAVMSILATTPVLAGDAAAGATKAQGCVACHGDNRFPGMFYTLQLAGRNADKLVIKTNKYRTGKIVNPIMNMSVMSLTDKDVEDIAAYYSKLGKPIVVNPMLPIKGDDADEPKAAAPAKNEVAAITK